MVVECCWCGVGIVLAFVWYSLVWFGGNYFAKDLIPNQKPHLERLASFEIEPSRVYFFVYMYVFPHSRGSDTRKRLVAYPELFTPGEGKAASGLFAFSVCLDHR